DYTVADYQTQAKEIIGDLNNNEIIPILVGGTGLYYQALVDNYTFYPMKTQYEIRKKWEQIVKEKGLDFAYEYLLEIDKEYAELISRNDQKRIIRAIEVYEITGQPFSSFQKRDTNTYKLACVGLYMERPVLYKRINERVLHMIDSGLIEEVLWLRKNGYDIHLKSMQSLGYMQVCYYLDGFLTKEQMIYEIQKETRRFAKRQFTWFNKDKRITWFEIDKNTDRAKLAEKISKHMEGQLFSM
ncbi:MAG: tRNA (adenosine(37)-N6)-dimethylallyltransferase MiaA, partial [Syntrophomonadaceae bacterium]|nr:tRNA (adenosine(37)-N6)-dimethylallyltransferase MiaA [Syntrophomonadaceae bacterium]